MNHSPYKIPRVSSYEIWYKTVMSAFVSSCGHGQLTFANNDYLTGSISFFAT
jgi:hypothetical protein